MDTMPSRPSLQRREMRLVLPAPLSPIHTTSYSGLGEGGPLQHSFRKHYWGRRQRETNGNVRNKQWRCWFVNMTNMKSVTSAVSWLLLAGGLDWVFHKQLEFHTQHFLEFHPMIKGTLCSVLCTLLLPHDWLIRKVHECAVVFLMK